MKCNEIIRTVLKTTGTTQTRLADAMGYANGQANVSRLLARNDLYVTTLIRLLDKMGYEIVVQPRTRGRRPEGQMVLTDE